MSQPRVDASDRCPMGLPARSTKWIPASTTVTPMRSWRRGDGWRRLSPRMLLVHPLQEARRVIWPLLAVVLFGQRIAAGVVAADRSRRRGRARCHAMVHHHLSGHAGPGAGPTWSALAEHDHGAARSRTYGRSDVASAAPRARTGPDHDRHRPDRPEEGRASARCADRRRGRAPAYRVAARAATGPPEPIRPCRSPHRPPMADRPIARLNPAWVRYAPFTLSGLVTIGVFAGFTANLINQTRVNVANNPALQSARRDLSSMSWVTATIVIILLIIVVVVGAVGRRVHSAVLELPAVPAGRDAARVPRTPDHAADHDRGAAAARRRDQRAAAAPLGARRPLRRDHHRPSGRPWCRTRRFDPDAGRPAGRGRPRRRRRAGHLGAGRRGAVQHSCEGPAAPVHAGRSSSPRSSPASAR